ncbi:MAG: hypothetical protein EOO13_16950 [Chitinophagaceae bacterium]|nr:MAG: hypothetical protein EOO13_16950 [Chitinophagaceae bacterium]
MKPVGQQAMGIGRAANPVKKAAKMNIIHCGRMESTSLPCRRIEAGIEIEEPESIPADRKGGYLGSFALDGESS